MGGHPNRGIDLIRKAIGHQPAQRRTAAMMIAEKASDMIRGRMPLAPVEGVAA